MSCDYVEVFVEVRSLKSKATDQPTVDCFICVQGCKVDSDAAAHCQYMPVHCTATVEEVHCPSN